MLAAHRAIGILAELEFAELHAQRVKEQQAADQIFTSPENQLDGFHCLDGANDAGQYAEHTAFCARWNKARRSLFRIKPTVTNPPRHAKSNSPDLEYKN